METVQLTISDGRYATALRDMLQRNGARAIRCLALPDPRQDGVMVIDSDALDRLPLPLLYPERVVLITKNDPQHLAQAWNAGIRSVVFNEDPLSTAVLAIMAAQLRVPKSGTCCAPGSAGGSAGPGKKCGNAPLVEMNSGAPLKSRAKEGLR